jgi:hypothetical protein
MESVDFVIERIAPPGILAFLKPSEMGFTS